MTKLVPGDLEYISQSVARIVAPNPGLMTGSGTNTYLIGQKTVAVVDPGPADQQHIDAIIKALPDGSQIKWIIATHTHHDHSPGAALLAEITGAEILGPRPNKEYYEDESFQPSRSFEHDERFDTGECIIRAIHTPGHVGNHFCFLVEGEEVLLTGDHIMSGSTVVIIPPSGDMKDYIHSLELLKSYQIRVIAPGHGEQNLNPFEMIQGIIDHRLKREGKVIGGMQKMCRATLDELTPVVYSDVPIEIHPIAQLSLLAHLIKLEKEQVVKREEEFWHLIN